MRRFLKVPAVFAVLLIVLTDSSAHATQIACHEAHCSDRRVSSSDMPHLRHG